MYIVSFGDSALCWKKEHPPNQSGHLLWKTIKDFKMNKIQAMREALQHFI